MIKLMFLDAQITYNNDDVKTDDKYDDADDGKGKQTEGGLKPARLTRNWVGSTLLAVAFLISTLTIVLVLRSLLRQARQTLFDMAAIAILLLVHLSESLVLAFAILTSYRETRRSPMIAYLPVWLAAFLDAVLVEYIVPVTSLATAVGVVLVVLYKLVCYAGLASQANDTLTFYLRPFHKTYKRHGLLIKLRDFA